MGLLRFQACFCFSAVSPKVGHEEIKKNMGMTWGLTIGIHSASKRLESARLVAEGSFPGNTESSDACGGLTRKYWSLRVYIRFSGFGIGFEGIKGPIRVLGWSRESKA